MDQQIEAEEDHHFSPPPPRVSFITTLWQVLTAPVKTVKGIIETTRQIEAERQRMMARWSPIFRRHRQVLILMKIELELLKIAVNMSQRSSQ